MEQTPCVYCKQKEAGPCEDFSFELGGFKFLISKDRLECRDCAKLRMAKKFEIVKEVFCRLPSGEVLVDWKRVREMRRSEQYHFANMEVLNSLGILSRSPVGNWVVLVDVAMFGGLWHASAPLYFTRKDDALAYAALEYRNAHYNWYVWHVREEVARSAVISWHDQTRCG